MITDIPLPTPFSNAYQTHKLYINTCANQILRSVGLAERSGRRFRTIFQIPPNLFRLFYYTYILISDFGPLFGALTTITSLKSPKIFWEYLLTFSFLISRSLAPKCSTRLYHTMDFGPTHTTNGLNHIYVFLLLYFHLREPS
jgi:hypothetical protein